MRAKLEMFKNEMIKKKIETTRRRSLDSSDTGLKFMCDFLYVFLCFLMISDDLTRRGPAFEPRGRQRVERDHNRNRRNYSHISVGIVSRKFPIANSVLFINGICNVAIFLGLKFRVIIWYRKVFQSIFRY